MSKVSCESIFAVLNQHYTDVGITVINNISDLEELITCRPDLVFLGMEFIPTNPTLGINDPNKIWLTDYLDDHEIAYTGSSKTAHALGRNKHLAKQRVLDANLMTSAFCVIVQNQILSRNYISLAFPLFIKPTNRGGGLGVDSDSVVHNFDQLRSKVYSMTTKLQSDALIEEYLPGREFSIAILKDVYSPRYSVMPIELVAPVDKNGARLLGRQIKSSNTEQVLEVIDEDIKSKIMSLALAVFYVLGGRDYGRIDIRLDASGTPHFLEANLIPSLISGYGSFPKACVLNMGLEYEPMVLRIAQLGLAHNMHSAEDVLELLGVSASVLSTTEFAFEQI